jgi:hypothetical protein
MPTIEPYRKRLRKAANTEFRTVFTPYRIWGAMLTAATFLIPIGVQVIRSGIHSLINFQQTLINASMGALISCGGTYLIAIWRAAKKLEDQWATELETLCSQIPQQLSPLDSIEQQRRDRAREYVLLMSGRSQEIARHVLIHGESPQGIVMSSTGSSNAELTEFLRLGRTKGFITEDSRPPQKFGIKPELHAAFAHALDQVTKQSLSVSQMAEPSRSQDS